MSRRYLEGRCWRGPPQGTIRVLGYDIAFKTLAFGGETGMQDALNNWNMRIAGDPGFLNLFGLLLLVSLGKMTR